MKLLLGFYSEDWSSLNLTLIFYSAILQTIDEFSRLSIGLVGSKETIQFQVSLLTDSLSRITQPSKRGAYIKFQPTWNIPRIACIQG